MELREREGKRCSADVSSLLVVRCTGKMASSALKEGHTGKGTIIIDRSLYLISADHFSYVQSYIMGLILTSKISQRNGLFSNYQCMGGLSK